MGVFRSDAVLDAYLTHIKSGGLARSCGLCDREPLAVYTHWKLIENKFPYDVIAREHHMLVPLRHATEHDLLPEELAELKAIKYRDDVQEVYDSFIEGTSRTRSIPAHYHLHLIKLHDFA
jgi:hypothetical protein